ncbi:MAG TPA: phosphatase domain-containing protein [Marinagarivorans sp.]
MDYRTQESNVDPDKGLPTVAQPDWQVKLKKRAQLLRPAEILPYRGHGTRHSLQIKGRVTEAAGKKSALFKRYTGLHNSLTIIRSLCADAMPGALIEARYRGETQRFYTDSEGYFLLNFWFPGEPLAAGWHNVELELLDSIGGSGSKVMAPSFVPSPDTRFAIVSDIDDTVLNSSAFNKIQQIKLTLFKDAASRTAVDEVTPLYQKLVKGPTGDGDNPIFYLSRSGWNLNNLLEEFLDINGLPAGPMFLRDLAWREAKSIALGSNNHKIDYIRTLMNTYPELPFVLLGDSGQHDPETYWQIAMENPGRVKAIYLHDLQRKKRHKIVKAICRDLHARDVPVIHSTRVSEYAVHMERLGLISAQP